MPKKDEIYGIVEIDGHMFRVPLSKLHLLNEPPQEGYEERCNRRLELSKKRIWGNNKQENDKK